ncbi:MAG: MFS transporter [Clostridiaceae bacterium]
MTIFSAFKQYKGLPREIYIIAIQRLVNSIGGFVYPFLAMFLSVRLGLPKDEIGRIMLITAIVGIPGSLIAGHLVDRFSRKPILVISSAMTAVIYIICGFLGYSHTIPYMIILSSFFSSFSNPASGAMISDLTTPENRKQSFSLLYLGMNMGLAFGFMFAGYLFENHTNWLFWGDGLTTLLSLLLVVFFVKDTRPSKKEIEQINQSDRIGEKEEKGSIFAGIKKRPFLTMFVLINAVITFVYKQYGFIAPFHLEELYPNQGAIYFGNSMMFNTLIVIFFTPIIMLLTKKYKPIVNVKIATITYIIGFGMLGFSKSFVWFFVSVFIWTTGEIIASVNVGVYISNHSPINHRGGFNSIITIINQFGRSFAPYIMGKYLVGHSNSQGWMLTAIVAIFAYIALSAVYYGEKHYKKIVK